MTTRRILSTTGDTARKLLQLVEKSTDMVPPLKSVASSALSIADSLKDFRTDEKQWQDFGEYVKDVTASVVQSLSQVSQSYEDARSKLEKLNATLVDIKTEIELEQASSKVKRVGRFLENSEKIADMRQRIESDIGLFQLSVTITSLVDVGKIFYMVAANGNNLSSIAQATSVIATETESISRKAAQLGLNATIDRLLRAPGASWDPDQACMKNTRVELIERILTWMNSPAESGGAEIMLLTAVAGAGKTTVAHTVACECHRMGQLGSSFFFDHKIQGRNSPTALFATVAADLSRLDPRIAEHISAAIEGDNSLPTAPVSRQFEELILKPCQKYPMRRPIVLVIDALDEAWDTRRKEDKAMSSLLKILRDRIPELPSTVRILLTSRMRPEISHLLRQRHVIEEEINIGSKSNMDDIAVYILSKLQELARNRNLGDDWPTKRQLKEFTRKAGGLFLWVATVCEYLANYDDLEIELDDLISTTSPPNSSAEGQMNELYTRILESFNWSDTRFAASYHRVMGAALATRTPLTITALEELYRERPLASEFTIERLSPLLTGVRGVSRGTEAVRMLHQSLRDFLLAGGTSSSGWTKFRIVEKDNSQQLASLCLELLNRDLSSATPGTGYLVVDNDEMSGIPVQVRDSIPEALQYACQFWQSHIQDIEIPGEIMPLLKTFMEQKVVLWMEIAAVCGRYYGVGETQKWGQRIDNSDIKSTLQCGEEYASVSFLLSSHLANENRREEALVAIQESEALYRQLATDQPAAFTPGLAMSLKYLSDRLCDMGRHGEALSVIEEVVQLCRQLAADRPAAFTPCLARSLYDLSNRLSDMGHREKALSVIEEAVQLCQQLAADEPAALTSGLAESLRKLSHCLCDMGRGEEALSAIEETVHVHRQLAAERPAAFTPDLARSLHDLFHRLSDMGRREDALAAIEEAVQLHRQLAADELAAVAPNHAKSLIQLSICLSGMGRREEALSAIKEAVHVNRQLAADRPVAFTPDLATSLNHLSHRLRVIDRREEALLAIKEAVQLRRQLAAERPAAFTPDLAMSLHDLSHCLCDMGRREEALSAIEEAVHVHRQLAAERPAVFTPDFAKSLHDLFHLLSDMGRHEEALLAIQETVRGDRQLAADQPAAFTPGLAGSLYCLSRCLSDMGRREEALSVIEEVVQLRRQLAVKQPAAFTLDLARSLHSLFHRLSDMGRHEEALSAIKEVVQLRRQLATDQSATFKSGFAKSFSHLYHRLCDMGRGEEALSAIEEAVQMYRQLAADQPATFTLDLTRLLGKLSDHLYDMGRREDALQVIQEAVSIRRELSASRPFIFNPPFKRSLQKFSDLLTKMDRHEEAQVVALKAAGLSVHSLSS
ncbi:POC1 centriolar protein A [Ceratobasidium sp. 428]|nr:POC1 centriolar protein A [Ceratobasidium sp. 428]